MKIAVYAIAKDEAKDAREWYKNVKDADGIYVMDGGSRDGTAQILSDLGCFVKIQPCVHPAYHLGVFRFDAARNLALDMVPQDVDICVAVDLDQRLSEGWRAALEAAWIDGATHGRFILHHSPEEEILYHHIHARQGAEWHGAVHEIVRFKQPEKHVLIDGLEMFHYPDTEKPRRHYSDLAKLSCDEEPDSYTARYFYARALYNEGKYEVAGREFVNLLSQRCGADDGIGPENHMKAWLYIADCREKLHDLDGARKAYIKAINTYPHLREPFFLYAMFLGRWDTADYAGIYLYAKHSLTINSKSAIYPTLTACFGYRPYDLVAMGAARLGRIDEAIACEKAALALAPEAERERLAKNIEKLEASRR